MKRKLLPFSAAISCLAFVLSIVTLGAPTVLPPLTGAQDGIAYADESSASQGVKVSISSQTPIIGSEGSSTYSLTVNITNGTQATVSAGTLRVSTNPDMTFSTTTDMQQWAEGTLDIWASGTIDRQTVASIPPGSSVSVTASGSIDDFPLNEITSFGARPILVRYATDDGATVVDEHTFVTFDNGSSPSDSRTNTHVTIAAPVAAKSWTTDTDKRNDLLTQQGSATSQGTTAGTGIANRTVSSIITPNLAPGSAAAVDAAHSHAALSLVADPYCLGSLEGSAVASALLPPADADLTAYSQSSADWGSAGITAESLSASRSSSIAAEAGTTASAQTVSRSARSLAWQGKGNWTYGALTAAQAAGYTTVISLNGNTGTATSTYHAVTHTITDQGSVGILNAESTLSSLASGNASSAAASAENSTAGRISRIVAQTSLGSVSHASDSASEAYSRLFIALDPSSSCADLDAVLGTLESAHWLSWDSLDTLIDAAQNSTSDAIVPAESGIETSTDAAYATQAQSLATSHNELERFFTSVLVAPQDPDSGDSTGPAATPSAADASPNRAGSDTASAGSASAPASADSSAPSGSSAPSVAPAPSSSTPSAANGAANAGGVRDSSAWQMQLEALHVAYAVRTLDAALDDSGATVNDAAGLASDVQELVHLQQPNSVVMMSATASLPLTIVNSSPFDVRVSVSARSGAANLTASGADPITIPARSEQQVTLSLQAYSSGSTYVDLQLLDAHAAALGGSVIVNVSNSLRLNDGLGNAIIAFAVILAAGGLWRQFHRKPVDSETTVAGSGDGNSNGNEKGDNA